MSNPSIGPPPKPLAQPIWMNVLPATPLTPVTVSPVGAAGASGGWKIGSPPPSGCIGLPSSREVVVRSSEVSAIDRIVVAVTSVFETGGGGPPPNPPPLLSGLGAATPGPAAKAENRGARGGAAPRGRRR